jgi:hypothetical protein
LKANAVHEIKDFLYRLNVPAQARAERGGGTDASR